ncbi:MAG: M20/M25/M40 family metallo-hydrolase [Clostridiales bacterium]|nr:M20/M25/M40 family metallo-hydrolase [Clostridiales bacterium]
MLVDKHALDCRIKEALHRDGERWIEDWLDIVAQPSISATGEGVEDCCRKIADKMRAAGLEPTVYPVKPYPVLFAQHGHDPAKRTVLIYAHYDVVPVGNLELWKTPPFTPTVIDGKVYARGSADNKSPLMAHVKAFEFWLREYGELPVNVKFLFEGCEESGSRGLEDFLRENRALLDADLVFFSDGPKNEKNIPIISLGAKGNVAIALTLTTLCKDAHSRYAPLLPSAAWQMVELLSKLKTGDRVHVPGFYDGIVPPTQQELDILNALPPIDQEIEAIYGVKPVYPAELGCYVHLNTTPTFNLKQLHSGDGANVVTSRATASLDIRLVEGQDPDDIFEKVKRYIGELGYGQVEAVKTGGVPPSKTPVENAYVPVIAEVTREVYGDYVIYPCRPSTAPDFLWTKIMGLPAIQVRWSDPDSDNHAPNEHLSIQEYLRGIELTCKVLAALGREDAAQPE